MQPFPHPSDATHKIWSKIGQLASEIFKFESVDDDDGRTIGIQSSRVITIIFTMETSTSDGISLGTAIFLSKFTIL